MIVLIDNTIQCYDDPRLLFCHYMMYVSHVINTFELLSISHSSIKDYIFSIKSSDNQGDYLAGKLGPTNLRHLVWTGRKYGPSWILNVEKWNYLNNIDCTKSMHLMRSHDRFSSLTATIDKLSKSNDCVCSENLVWSKFTNSLEIKKSHDNINKRSGSVLPLMKASEDEYKMFTDTWKNLLEIRNYFKLPRELSLVPFKKIKRILKSSLKYSRVVPRCYQNMDRYWILEHVLLSAEQQQEIKDIIDQLYKKEIFFPFEQISNLLADYERIVLKIKTSRFLKDSLPNSDFARYCLLMKNQVFSTIPKSRRNINIFWKEIWHLWNLLSEEERSRKMLNSFGVMKSWADDEEMKLFIGSSDSEEEVIEWGETNSNFTLESEDDDDDDDRDVKETENLDDNSIYSNWYSWNGFSETKRASELNLIKETEDELPVDTTNFTLLLNENEHRGKQETSNTVNIKNKQINSDENQINLIHTQSGDENYGTQLRLENGIDLSPVTCAIKSMESTPENIETADENVENFDFLHTSIHNSDSSTPKGTNNHYSIDFSQPGALSALLDSPSSCDSSVKDVKVNLIEELFIDQLQVQQPELSLPEKIDKYEKLSGVISRPTTRNFSISRRSSPSSPESLHLSDSVDTNHNYKIELRKIKPKSYHDHHKILRPVMKRASTTAVVELRRLVDLRPVNISTTPTPRSTSPAASLSSVLNIPPVKELTSPSLQKREITQLEADQSTKKSQIPKNSAKVSISSIFAALLDDNMRDLATSAEYKNKIVHPEDLYNRIKISADKPWDKLSKKTKDKYYGAFLRRYSNKLDHPEAFMHVKTSKDKDALEVEDVVELVRVCAAFDDWKRPIFKYATKLVDSVESRESSEIDIKIKHVVESE